MSERALCKAMWEAGSFAAAFSPIKRILQLLIVANRPEMAGTVPVESSLASQNHPTAREGKGLGKCLH